MDILRSEKQNEEEMIPFRCPLDGSLILRYSKGTIGVVEGKCKRCHNLWTRKIKKPNTEQQSSRDEPKDKLKLSFGF